VIGSILGLAVVVGFWTTVMTSRLLRRRPSAARPVDQASPSQ